MQSAQREARFSEGRFIFLQWGIVAVFVLLLSGFWRLQVFQPAYYARLAENNRTKRIPIPAPRGRIIDRYGRVLVDNYPAFSIVADWEMSEKLEPHLPAIAAGLGLNQEQLMQRVRTARKNAPYRQVAIRETASLREIAFVESHRSEFPELEVMSVQQRLYPQGEFAAHLLGYVGEVSESDLRLPALALLQPGEMIGKAAIERQYDDVLRGQNGERRVIVNSLGKEVALLDEVPPVSGQTLRLTIDYDLQELAERSFAGDSGALVALDPRSGEVLALVSRPGYDANLFTAGIPAKEWRNLLSDQQNPLLNRAIQAQLAPGSIYKILLAAASLEAGAAEESTTFYCSGGATFYNRYFRCWKRGGHGRIGLHRAIVQSCDVFFYNLGKNLGIERMAAYSMQFGLGRLTGIDLPHEGAGTMPSPEWKERLFRQKWYAGETISVAIGQGAMTTTPLQIAYSVGGIASGGYFARPHLVSRGDLQALGRDVPSPRERRVALSEETITAVTDGLYGVVNEGGTGSRARIQGIDVGGKTGTAQVASLQAAKNASEEDPLRDNAWFVGLAPRRNPEIVVAVLYEGGEHGYLAAPIARDVIKTYFDKKRASEPQLAQTPDTDEEGVAVAAQAPRGEG